MCVKRCASTIDWRDDNRRVYAKGARFYDLIQTGRRVAKDYGAEAAELDALIRSRNPGARTLLDVACGTGQLHFAESHRLWLVPTSDLTAAIESAGLRAEVLPDSMPGRDRVLGVRVRQ